MLAGAAMRIINQAPNRLSIRALDVHPDDVVLELGFGPGEAIRALAHLAGDGKVYGVDASATMLAQAGRRNLRAISAGRVELHQGSFERLPFPGASVDKVLAVNVAYFWTDPDAVLQELGRVLRPGGRLCVFAMEAAAMRRWRFAGPETHRLFDADALAGLLAHSPFGRGDIRVTAHKLGPGLPGLIGLARRRA